MNTIQAAYGTNQYGMQLGGLGAKRVDSGNFLVMALQAKGAVSNTGAAAETAGAGAATLEDMLRAKYPSLTYHVFDASSGYWQTRNDYPHYLLYQPGDKAAEVLENWTPSGENPFYGSVDGRFMCSKEQSALSRVPPGSKAVVIHPAVQARMEEDPAYAAEIFQRIDTWFTFDVARNEAIIPGSTAGMNQAVAIGEDGSIVNACSSGSGGRITYSRSGTDDELSWWDLRMARHAEFMQLLVEDSIQHAIQMSGQFSDLNASLAAKAQLAEMLNGGNLESIFGDTIAGVSTAFVLDITRQEIWAM